MSMSPSSFPTQPFFPPPPPSSASRTSLGPSWLLPALSYAAAAGVGGLLTYSYVTYFQNRSTSTTASKPPPRSSSSSHTTNGRHTASHVSTRSVNNAADPLDPEWFRLHGHELIDFIADYRAQLNDPHSATAPTPNQLPPLPIQCQLQPGWLAKSLPSSPPTQPEPWSAVMADVKAHIVPGLTHWQSPHFYAWFKNHASYPSFMGDMLSSAFSSVGFSWLSSPASAELEAVVMDWCAQLFALPRHFWTASGKGGGSICQTAGEAGIIALLTAKRKAMEGYEEGSVEESVREERERKLVLYVSDQAHGILGRAVKVSRPFT